ncbi:MAG: hypothetical protein F6K42_30380 [Leptolyngbya sp. SIO1D8]|nr:hypothetical protein [Leptolyngbya sp. SIO1D8]
MNAYKLEAQLTEDGALLLKGLPFQAGDSVEIIILEQPPTPQAKLAAAPSEHPLRGTVIRYDNPFEPAVADDEWEVLK